MHMRQNLYCNYSLFLEFYKVFQIRSFNTKYCLNVFESLVIEGTQIHLVFGQENRWKHGNPLLELFMRKEAYSFVSFGTLEECPTMVSGFSNT